MEISMSPITDIVAADEEGIARAAAAVLSGQVVGYPTETLYGLGVDALSQPAVDLLTRIKGRQGDQPIPVLVDSVEMLERLVASVPPAARVLMATYWPGPLTLVLPAASGLPGAVVNERGGVGVRISSDPIASALVRQVGRPLTSTSANLAGSPPATDAARACLEGVRLVLDGGPRCQQASTVVEVMPGTSPVVLRQGAAVLPGRS